MSAGQPVLAGTEPYFPLDRFGHDPWWLIIAKVVAVFVFPTMSTVMSSTFFAVAGSSASAP